MYHLLIVTHFFVLLPAGELEDAGEEGELQLSWWRKWTRNTKYENTPCSVLMLLEKNLLLRHKCQTTGTLSAN